MKRSVFVLALVFLVAGCSGDDETTLTTTETTSTELAANRVYFLRDGKVWPVLRDVPGTGDVVDELVAGPTDDEEQLGLSSAITEAFDVSVADGVASIETQLDLTVEQRAQLVYSLTEVDPKVPSVEVGGTVYTRADFEDQTPAILVESPLAFEEVSSPLRVTGTANTFEATFSYELTDTDGRIVDEDFVTATSGTGTRGTFDFTTAPYAVPFDGVGSLIVFERSAQDGSRINLVEIPLRMVR